MSRYVNEFTTIIKNYQEVFDVYYCSDELQAKEYFYLHEFPDVIPFVTIIDSKRRVGLKSPRNPKELIPLKSMRPIEEGSYIFKTRKLIMFNKIQEDLQKLIDEFLDDELQMFYQTEKIRQATKVREVCAENFEKEVIKNNDVRHFVVEIFKHDCPSCAFNGKVFNAFSRKVEKHGYGGDLPLFRLSIDNKIPFLGNFGYSPIYMFVKKDADN
jgi:hypothetical protein